MSVLRNVNAYRRRKTHRRRRPLLIHRRRTDFPGRWAWYGRERGRGCVAAEQWSSSLALSL